MVQPQRTISSNSTRKRSRTIGLKSASADANGSTTPMQFSDSSGNRNSSRHSCCRPSHLDANNHLIHEFDILLSFVDEKRKEEKKISGIFCFTFFVLLFFFALFFLSFSFSGIASCHVRVRVRWGADVGSPMSPPSPPTSSRPIAWRIPFSATRHMAFIEV